MVETQFGTNELPVLTQVSDPVRSSSSHRARRRPILALGAATAIVSALLSGCGTGKDAETSAAVPAVDGAHVTVGDCLVRQTSCIVLSALAVSSPPKGSWAKGSDATLEGLLVNSGEADDVLQGVSTDAATSVSLYKNFADASKAAAVSASASASAASASASPSPAAASKSASASASESPSPSASPAPEAPAALDSAPIDAHSRLRVGFSDDAYVLVLHSLTEQLYPGQTIKVTFSFAKAGNVAVDVAVHLTSGPATAPASIDISVSEG